MNSLSFQQKLYSWIYFALLVVLVIILYKDYGVSWDEPIQRGIGNAAYEYAVNGNGDYLKMYDKIYGVGFELPLIFLEKGLGLTDTRDIFLSRHLVQGLFFAFACFVFFRMNLRLFGSFKIAIVPTLILLFSPRIFGHSFFNSKDIPFLCMYIISYNALHRYLIKPSYFRLILLALCAGLLINFRIMGLLFFGSSLVVLVIYLIQKRERKFIFHLLSFVSVASLILYATWPYLWRNPLHDLVNSFVLMSKFPWQGSMIFKGQIFHPGERLAEYLFGWIMISVPVLYLVSAFSGVVFFMVKTISKPKKMLSDPMKIMGWVFIGNAIAPVAAVLYLHSVLYDDWRQLYFIYPPIIVFSGYLLYYAKQWKPKIAALAGVVCIFYSLFIAVQMFRLHPFEHVYFNETVPKTKDYIRLHYEEDYWGTSFYIGLKYLAEHDNSDTIKVFIFSDALRRNAMLLPEKDRKRFVFLQNEPGQENSGVAESKSDYFLTNFRYDTIDIIGTSAFKNLVFSVERQNSPILRIWKH